ncbi:MAG: hypothetical protein M0Q49_11860 [Porticoccaceae bacterium]|nr:hypothetical protein [Porticoccaceae bacterium]
MSRLTLSALVSGLIFGLGLLVSGLGNPAKVLAFLDLAGAWDPSLALVMGGAILVGLIAFQLAARRQRSVLDEPIRLPTRRDIDRRLVLGSLGFGVGWGLAGFCPGPAVMAIGAGEARAVVFVLAMLAGMGVFELIERQR